MQGNTKVWRPFSERVDEDIPPILSLKGGN